MKFKVVLFLDGNDGIVDEQDVRQLLRDALNEFESPRTPVDRYVAERYSSQPEAFRKKKEEEVKKRIKISMQLRRQLGNMKLEGFETLD